MCFLQNDENKVQEKAYLEKEKLEVNRMAFS